LIAENQIIQPGIDEAKQHPPMGSEQMKKANQ
jgi:hypothetical protein